ncbi:MAG: hypothetical protein DMH00_02400 [Acidobacteria bacterium]|nr:MAG: hypothetical protein DMH00_02400 [Acidobacteriota bacterium]
MGNGFVFDDRVVIQENQNLRSLSGLAGLWVTPYWSGEGRSNRLYRPVTILSFALNYAAGGGAPWTFHLVNLLLHTLVCMTLMALLTRLFGWGFLPLAGAALFCVHPLLSEAVAGVVGRAEILSALFILSALLLDRFPAGSSRRRNAVFAGSAVLFFLAILAKENALAYPGLVLLTDQLMGRPEGTQRRLRVTELVILVAIAGVYLLLRARVLGVLMEPGAIPPIDNPLAHVPATRRVVTALFLTCRYLGLFVFPAKLSADYSAPQIVPVNGVSDPGAVLGVAVIATLAFLG